LDKRLKRMAQLEANGNRPQQIEKTINQPQTQPQIIETPKPLSRTTDRRFRRM
jgi:hypothetical protein